MFPLQMPKSSSNIDQLDSPPTMVLRTRKLANMPAKRKNRAFSRSEVKNDKRASIGLSKNTVSWSLDSKADTACQTDFNDVTTLIDTNGLLAKQLIEKTNLIESKDQKYIMVLKHLFKERSKHQELAERFKQQEIEISGMKKHLQELNAMNFCDDLIQLEGTAPIDDTNLPLEEAIDEKYDLLL